REEAVVGDQRGFGTGVVLAELLEDGEQERERLVPALELVDAAQHPLDGLHDSPSLLMWLPAQRRYGTYGKLVSCRRLSTRYHPGCDEDAHPVRRQGNARVSAHGAGAQAVAGSRGAAGAAACDGVV